MENSIYIKNRQELRKWLSENYQLKNGLWLIFDKGKNRQMSYDDIVEELICYAWIDSKVGKVSETQSKLWIAPRNPKSNWSALNKTRVAKLVKLKLLAAPGKKSISEAKKSGTWTALDLVESLTIPEDLTKEFKKHHNSAVNFEAFPRSVKRAILEWIQSAKKTETRQKRIEETAKQAAQKIRANQWRQ